MRLSAKMGLMAVLLLGSAGAQAQTLDREYKDWNVFTMQQGGQKICYIASAPVSKKGNYAKRDEPYLLVTHRSAEVDEVSVSSGYPYKLKSEVQASVDGKKEFKMFTKDEIAWTYTEKSDKEMVEAMKKGSKMKVKGTSQKGTYSDDTYSLRGFTAAYQRMKSLCK